MGWLSRWARSGASTQSASTGAAGRSAAGRTAATRTPGRRGDGGAGRHGEEEGARAAGPVQPDAAGRAGGGGLPLQQPAAGDGEPHHRHQDGVDHGVGLARQEGELQGDPGRGGGGVLQRARAGRSARAGARPGRPAPRPPGRRPGRPSRPGAARVQRSGSPGSTVQPRTRSSTVAGATRARRRLSRIFQRAMRDSRLRCQAGAGLDEREQPAEDLPVAAGPAVLAAGVGQHAGGVVVHHLHVGDQAGAGVEPLEEIVGEEHVVRDPPVERRHEGVHVVEPLAGEAPLAEEVLVDVGHGGGVGVDAGVAGVEAREAGAGGAGGGDAHARLEDAVALGDPARGRIEARAVERVEGDADQLAGRRRAAGGCPSRG